MNASKIVYWISTILCVGVFTFSASMYFTKTQMVEGFFEALHYPKYIVIPLAIAKVLAIAAVLYRKNSWAKEWAYAGLTFDSILALAAHVNAGDGGYMMSGLALIATVVSYIFEKKIQ